jgi:hypothetical protein
VDDFSARRLTLRVVGCTGAALFAAFLALTFHTPRSVENFGRSYIEAQVLEAVDARIDALASPSGDAALPRYAVELLHANQTELSQLRQSLKSGARAQLAACIAQLLELSDTQRATLQTLLVRGAEWRIADLGAQNSRLAGLIQYGYLQVVDELRRDIRIFTASNAVAFLLLIIVSFFRPDAVRQLTVPATLLVLATLMCAYAYVFEQNWLLTIIHGDYLGFAYTGYLVVVFLFYCDIALNRGRVTARILESIFNTVGSAAA